MWENKLMEWDTELLQWESVDEAEEAKNFPKATPNADLLSQNKDD